MDSQRSVSDLQAAVEAAKSHHPEPPPLSALEDDELPPSPSETKVVLLVVDPYLVHAYWDLGSGKLPGTDFRAVLRFYDTTEAITSTFDVAIDLPANNWYVHLWSPARSYHVELGLIAERGGFTPLARSNAVQTPRAWPVTEVEEYFLQVGVEESRVPSVPAESVEDSPAAEHPESSPPASEAPAPASEAPTPASEAPTPASEALTPAPAPPVLPQPVNAVEILQKRLTELYTSRQRPSRAFSVRIARNDSPKAPPGGDFTGRAERRFSAGISSAHIAGKT